MMTFPTEWKINPIVPNHQSDTGVWYRTYGNICTANVMGLKKTTHNDVSMQTWPLGHQKIHSCLMDL